MPAVLAKLAIKAPTSRTMSKMPIIFAPSLAGKQQHLSTGPQHITTTCTEIVNWNYSLALERKKIKIYIQSSSLILKNFSSFRNMLLTMNLKYFSFLSETAILTLDFQTQFIASIPVSSAVSNIMDLCLLKCCENVSLIRSRCALSFKCQICHILHGDM